MIRNTPFLPCLAAALILCGCATAPPEPISHTGTKTSRLLAPGTGEGVILHRGERYVDRLGRFALRSPEIDLELDPKESGAILHSTGLVPRETTFAVMAYDVAPMPMPPIEYLDKTAEGIRHMFEQQGAHVETLRFEPGEFQGLPALDYRVRVDMGEDWAPRFYIGHLVFKPPYVYWIYLSEAYFEELVISDWHESRLAKFYKGIELGPIKR